MKAIIKITSEASAAGPFPLGIQGMAHNKKPYITHRNLKRDLVSLNFVMFLKTF